MTRALLVIMLVMGAADTVLADPCPPPAPETVCVTWTEPVTTGLKQAVFTFFKNGVEQPALSMSASSPSGGQVRTLSFPTVPCEKAIYTGSGHNEYLSGVTSDEHPVLPETGLVKDRTAECVPPPPSANIATRMLDADRLEVIGLNCRALDTTGRGTRRIVTCLH